MAVLRALRALGLAKPCEALHLRLLCTLTPFLPLPCGEVLPGKEDFLQQLQAGGWPVRTQLKHLIPIPSQTALLHFQRARQGEDGKGSAYLASGSGLLLVEG